MTKIRKMISVLLAVSVLSMLFSKNVQAEDDEGPIIISENSGQSVVQTDHGNIVSTGDQAAIDLHAENENSSITVKTKDVSSEDVGIKASADSDSNITVESGKIEANSSGIKAASSINSSVSVSSGNVASTQGNGVDN